MLFLETFLIQLHLQWANCKVKKCADFHEDCAVSLRYASYERANISYVLTLYCHHMLTMETNCCRNYILI